MATKLPITILDRSSNGGYNWAPGVQFITPVVGQDPLYVDHFTYRSAGEQPVACVRMRDGTYAPINQNLLVNNGQMIYF